MKTKKIAKRTASSTYPKIKKKSASHVSIYYVRYIITPALILLLVLIGKFTFKSISHPLVLGTSTYLLGDESGSNDSGSGGGSNRSESFDTNNSGSLNSSDSSGGENHSEVLNSGETLYMDTPSSVANTTRVDCVGPDGKHFQTEFKNCRELNQAWHRSNFSFTPLSQSIQTSDRGKTLAEPNGAVKQDSQEGSSDLVKTEDNAQEVDLHTKDLRINISTEEGKLVIKAKKPDGSEVGLDRKDALEKINDVLKDKGIELATSSASRFIIREGETETETELPISVDPQTRRLTVTTSAGVKDVTVLPEQAVSSLLATNILSNVETKLDNSSISSESSSLASRVTLTSLNNQPVFAVNGVSNKKLLGILPMQFGKTVFVSTETGQVVKINQSPLTKLLESLSF